MKARVRIALFMVLLMVTGLMACGKATSGETKDANAVATAIKENIDFDYVPDTELDQEQFASMYGITEDMYTSFYCAIPMISVLPDQLILVAPAAGKEEQVKEALENYRNTQIEATFQYPMNAAKLNLTQVYAEDGIVCYIALFGDTTAYETDDAQLEAICKERVDQVIQIIKEN